MIRFDMATGKAEQVSMVLGGLFFPEVLDTYTVVVFSHGDECGER